LLIDVDGVISLFGFDHTSPPAAFPVAVDGIPHWISEGAGPRLIRLARTFECVWCTGWEERAEEHLPRLLGLPGGWPHLTFRNGPGAQPRHWKLDAIESHAGPDRPLAWVDDAFDAGCDAWAAERTAPTLLVRTDPVTGLRPEHVSVLERWARRL
jgi:hypothetical protein